MDKLIKHHFDQYPENARTSLLELRSLILKVASELGLNIVEESLKWNEPSYKVKTGSPIRLDWKQQTTNNYYLFFNCKTKLVDTFRELYGDALVFQGNRAIVFNLEEPLPEPIIKHCIELALSYHQRKHLPLLGS